MARILSRVSRLAGQGILALVQSVAYRVGNPGHLLFEPAVAVAEPRVGRSFCVVRHLRALPVAPPVDVPRRKCALSWRGDVVGLDLSIA